MFANFIFTFTIFMRFMDIIVLSNLWVGIINKVFKLFSLIKLCLLFQMISLHYAIIHENIEIVKLLLSNEKLNVNEYYILIYKKNSYDFK